VTADVSWDDLSGDLPAHEDEIMASHPGQPSEEQHVKNGATPASGGP
jgi:hypothetical protein